MNFNEIKSGFIDYIVNKEVREKGIDESEVDRENISLFSYFSEFKNYLIKENIADSSIFTKSYSDIKSMSFVDGKLVENLNDIEETENIPDKDNDLMIDLLNDILSQEDVINSLDNDESGDLNEDEVNNFLFGLTTDENDINDDINLDSLEEPLECMYYLNTIYQDEKSLQYLDLDCDGKINKEERKRFETFALGDNEQLSADNLFDIYSSILDGSFPVEKYRHFEYKNIEEDTRGAENIVETPETQTINVEDTKASEKTESTSSSSSGGASYSSSSYSSGTSNVKTVSTDPLNGKSYDELQTMKTEKESKLNESHQLYQDILSGNDEDVQNAQKNVNDLQEAYLTALENDDAISEADKQKTKRIRELTEQLANIQQESLETFAAVDAQQTFITQQNAKITMDETNLNALKSTLSSLPAENSENEEQNSKIEQYRNELNAQIQAAEEILNEDKQKLTEPNGNGRTPQEELEYLQNYITELNKQSEECENELTELEQGNEETGAKGILESASEETKEAYRAYTDAKDNLQNTIVQKSQAVLSNINIQQQELNSINQKLNEITPNEIKKQYSLQAPLFDDNITLMNQYYDKKDTGLDLSYLVVGPESADPSVEYPVLVYLHGQGEFGNNASTLETSSMAYVLINGQLRNAKDINLQNFNGYVVFPQASGGSWQNDDRIGQVCDVLDDLSQRYNINKDMISLSGHSVGGSGAIYFAQNFNNSTANNGRYSLNKVAALSPTIITNASNISVPIRYYNEERISSEAEINLRQNPQEQNYFYVNAEHANVPEYAYVKDEGENRNGCSDLIEWLFS